LSQLSRVLITGANGHLGRRLIARLEGQRPVRAVVRSTAAARLVNEGRNAPIDTVIVDYTQASAMRRACEDCGAVVHLAGILKATARNPYDVAHEGTCRALASAAEAAGVARIVYLSILGARPDAKNACLASKGRAERLLLDGVVPSVVLRVPMVLGEGDYASAALLRRARGPRAILLRAASREQPIYAGDVVEAIVAVLDRPDLERAALDLAGPESLTRRALVLRAARVLGTRPSVVSLPLALGLAGAAVLERTMSDPPVTTAMLGVLDHDDAIDPLPGAERLGIRLTPLEDTLERIARENAQ
jgi:NADH dehydrogenase